jgi:ribulose kinase
MSKSFELILDNVADTPKTRKKLVDHIEELLSFVQELVDESNSDSEIVIQVGIDHTLTYEPIQWSDSNCEWDSSETTGGEWFLH